MFSASFRVLTRSICVKNTFLGYFLEFELYVLTHIAQDDTFYCYLVPSSDKTAEKIFLVKILHINDHFLRVETHIFEFGSLDCLDIAHNERTE